MAQLLWEEGYPRTHLGSGPQVLLRTKQGLIPDLFSMMHLALYLFYLLPLSTLSFQRLWIQTEKGQSAPRSLKSACTFHEITETVDTYMRKVPNTLQTFLCILTGRRKSAKPT